MVNKVSIVVCHNDSKTVARIMIMDNWLKGETPSELFEVLMRDNLSQTNTQKEASG